MVKREEIFFDKCMESEFPVTFYNPPDTHKVIFKTSKKIDL